MKYLNSLCHKRGFTLIEILVSLTLLSIMIISFTPLLVRSFERIVRGGDRSIETFKGQRKIESLDSSISRQGIVSVNGEHEITVSVFEKGLLQYFKGWPDSEGYIYNRGKHEEMWVKGYNYKEEEGTQNKHGNQLYLCAAKSNDFEEITYVSTISVDLTYVNRIDVEWQNMGDNSNHNKSYIVASTNDMGSHNDYDAQLNLSGYFDTTVSELDVSSLTGEYFIRIHARDDQVNQERESKLIIYSIRLI